ncbi:MAG: peptidylprolyl isomerase [Campylobacter sp.]|nr:peptidylprolyl isomerase [Campylobacter sp.]
MSQNRVISMQYELKDANTGEILESNWNSNEISFISGLNQIIAKLEEEVLKLSENEETKIFIASQDATGEYDPSALKAIPKEQFAGIDLVEGMELFGEEENGAQARVIVKSIGDEEVMVDFNHPYAGKDLEFKIKVIENREATEDEILMGVPQGAHVCSCGSHSHDEDDECCGGHGHGDGGCCGRHHHG